MADELRDIASKIKRDREKGLSVSDLDAIAKRVKEIGDKESIDPEMLAKMIAKSTASVLSSRLPSPKDFVSAIVNSNPLLKITSTIFNKVAGGLGEVFGGSKKSREDEANMLLREIERMREELTKGPQPPEFTDPIVDAMNRSEVILKEMLEQLQLINSFEAEQASRANLLRLQNLDQDKGATEQQRKSDTDKLLGKMLALQERSFALDLANSIKGIFTGILTTLSGVVGGLLGGGLVSTLGRIGGGIMTGAKWLGRVLGPIGLVVGASMELYEGFQKAADFFGTEQVSTFDKIRYAMTHLLSSLVAPFDWIMEWATGEESNMRGKLEEWLIGFQDKAMSLLAPIGNVITDVFDWIGSTFKKMAEGITLDTKLVDIPDIFYANLSNMFADIWNSISFTDIAEEVKRKFTSGLDMATSLYDSMMNTVETFTKEIFNSMLEWIASAFANQFGFVGGMAAGSLRDMKYPGVPNSEYVSPKEESVFSKVGEVQGGGFKQYSDATNSQLASEALAARAAATAANQKKPDMDSEKDRLAANAHKMSYNQNVVTPINQQTTVVSRTMAVDPPGRLVPTY